MKTNPKGVLPALLKERAVLTSEVKRALANAKLDIKKELDREVNELLFPYDIWVSLPDVRKSYGWEDCELRWVLTGDVELIGSERLDVPNGSMRSMPRLRGHCNPKDGLEGLEFELSVQTKSMAHVNFRFAHHIVVKLDELKDLFKKANVKLQVLLAPIQETYNRLEVVNQELRELTNGTHGASLDSPVFKEDEPYDSSFLGFDDDDHDDDWGGGLPPF